MVEITEAMFTSAITVACGGGRSGTRIPGAVPGRGHQWADRRRHSSQSGRPTDFDRAREAYWIPQD